MPHVSGTHPRALNFADDSVAGSESLGFDAHVVEDADEEVGKQRVFFGVESQVSLMLEIATGQQNGQVVVVVR